MSTKYNTKLNLDLGCKNNLIKNFKAFDYIPVDDGTYGVGVSSVYIPPLTFLKEFGV